MKEQFENGYSQLYKRIEAMQPELQEVFWKHWDESGQPKSDKSETHAIIDILKKNSSAGYIGFKLDMANFFEKESFSEKQMQTYYSVFIGGAKLMAERLSKSVEQGTQSTPAKAVYKIN